MKKKIRNILLLLLADASVIPGCLLCKWLTEQMLSTTRPCAWSYFGGRCVSCGGTHFVNTLVQGKLGEAFMHNQLFFVMGIVLVLSWVLFHVAVIFQAKFAKKILKAVYSIPGLIVTGVSVVLFVILRNIPLFVRIGQMVIQLIN